MKELKQYLTRRNNGFYYIGTVQDNGKISWKSTKTKKKSEAMQLIGKVELKEDDFSHVELKLSGLNFMLINRLQNVIRPGTLKGYTSALQNLISIVGDMPITAIGQKEVELFKALRIKDKLDEDGNYIPDSAPSPSTVNIDLRSLKAIFNRAVKWELIARNPFTRVEFLRVKKITPAYLETKEQLQELLKQVKTDDVKDLFTFAVYTGLRKGELLSLTWDAVDLEARQIAITNKNGDVDFEAKNKSSNRVVPLADIPVEILKKRLLKKSDRTNLVFHRSGYKYNDLVISHQFKNAARDAKLSHAERLHFHSTRHTAISWMLMAGIDVMTVARICGHSDLTEIQAVYGHLTEQHKLKEIQRLNAF